MPVVPLLHLDVWWNSLVEKIASALLQDLQLLACKILYVVLHKRKHMWFKRVLVSFFFFINLTQT